MHINQSGKLLGNTAYRKIAPSYRELRPVEVVYTIDEGLNASIDRNWEWQIIPNFVDIEGE